MSCGLFPLFSVTFVFSRSRNECRSRNVYLSCNLSVGIIFFNLVVEHILLKGFNQFFLFCRAVYSSCRAAPHCLPMAVNNTELYIISLVPAVISFGFCVFLAYYLTRSRSYRKQIFQQLTLLLLSGAIVQNGSLFLGPRAR